jgi:hypothetical protein
MEPAMVVGSSFAAAELSYTTALETVMPQVRACRPVQTEECADLILRYESVDQEASRILETGRLLRAGLRPPTVACDETVSPGCTAAARLQELANLAAMLTALVAQLEGN